MPTTIPQLPLPDRYRVTAHIANGGMAAVWAAEDSMLQRRVAVKLLASHFAEDPAAVERFQREARAAARLSGHPNVVTIYDVGEQDGRPYIVMEHMEGGSLADVMRDGARPNRREAMAWLREAATALDAAHEAGIVHRDVKPGNLLLDQRRRLGIADFGIARVALEETLTSTGQVLGTAAYMSPEQISGAPAAPASDRYSLGVVAYQLLTGTRPFDADNVAAQARAQVDDDPAPPSRRAADLPPAVDEVLLRALAKEPGERWPTATALVDALERALGPAAPGNAGIEPTAPTRPAASRSPVRTSAAPWWRRRAAAIAALIGLALAAVLALVLSAGGGSQRPASRPSEPKSSTTPASKPQTTPAGSQDSGAGTVPPPGQDEDGAALNDQGFALSRAGRYGEAIPILRRAVDAACPSSGNDLTCAYALFNLGHALRLAGRPAEAIPFLERRLEFSNQRAVVQSELDLARAQAGQGAGAGSGAASSRFSRGQGDGESGNGKATGKAKDRGKADDQGQ